MSMSFVVETPEEAFLVDVGRFSDAAEDISPALPVVRQNIMTAMFEVFAQEGKGIKGGKWKKLSNRPWRSGRETKWGDDIIRPGYKDWKTGEFANRWMGTRGDGSWWAYRGPQGPMFPKVLSLSGRLQESLTGRSPFQYWSAYANGFVFGSSLIYAGVVAAAGPNRPARPILNWDMKPPAGQVWNRAIAKPVARYLQRGMKSVEKYGYIGEVDFDHLDVLDWS